MKLQQEQIFNMLIEVSDKLNIEIIEDEISGSNGGYFVLKGKKKIIFNRSLVLSDKIDILVNNLSQHDLSNIYISPAVRKILSINNEYDD